MKLLALIISVIVINTELVIAQNLIPNPGFEEYSTCPTFTDQVFRLTSWFKPTAGTSDYYNECALENSYVSVPENFLGYQFPNSGMGYCGFTIYTHNIDNTNHEYLEVPLLTPLIENTCYQFEMHVCLSNDSKIASDAINVYLSDTIISGVNNIYPLPFTPQITNSTGIITDTLNWILISSEYMANGGEKYLIIGNFAEDSLTNFLITGNHCPTCLNIAYYYIDDVSLTPCSHNSIENSYNSRYYKVYPNPIDQNSLIEFNHLKNESCVLNLYNATGQIVKTISNINTGTVEIERGNLAGGIYFFTLKAENGKVLIIGKLMFN